MKKNKDQQAVSDILKKLQASYLGGGKNSEKKKKEDDEDLAFRNKLAAMLGKLSHLPKKTPHPKRQESPRTSPPNPQRKRKLLPIRLKK